ncbi:MAG: hypothetical protein AABX12_04460 [Nanoarchaeota archaeon]
MSTIRVEERYFLALGKRGKPSQDTGAKTIIGPPYEVLGRGRGDAYVRVHINGGAAPTLEFLNIGSCAYARAKKWLDKRRVLEDGRTKARVSLEGAIELLKLSN